MIELKNDSEVRGVVQTCDEKMNVLLSQAVMTSHKGKSDLYDEMMVKGKSIRFVHFPSFVNVYAQLAQYRRKIEWSRRKNQPNKIVARRSESLQKRKIEEIVLDNSQRREDYDDDEYDDEQENVDSEEDDGERRNIGEGGKDGVNDNRVQS